MLIMSHLTINSKNITFTQQLTKTTKIAIDALNISPLLYFWYYED